ncbi:hypothetical protein QBC40DRAFT_283115 [Triangularia verruculosa]|uniref:N-acetyltransferase ESCO zinc-finger domain-containing protein n=1 Tax=Triangularia verruculosa TaxID=2587418 RepID=A0AAN7AVC8_9PEZI|nr:hypothetical protein QBC40DRAFT_283115 [Triangularia verruculosa]
MSLDPSLDLALESATSLPRPRKRPLRTYGRQSASTRYQDQKTRQVKKQKIVTQEEDQENQVPEPTEESPIPTLPEPPKQVSTIQKRKGGSIMSYFKPLPLSTQPISDASLSPATPTTLSDAPELVDDPKSTPPSSPPSSALFKRSRERRRLQSKVTICSLPGVAFSREPSPAPVVTSDGEEIYDQIIVRGDWANENDTTSEISEDTRSITTETGERKRAPLKQKQMVQTVLNLSINRDPGILICKDCGVLYNPLNEQDRKEHKRQHAAHVRSLKAKSTS